jgi:uncharacterized protein (UPF0332 family)
MSFDRSGFFTLAEKLAREAKGSITEEAALRSAISRAYYAVFTQARHELKYSDKDRLIPKSALAHEYVKNKFKSSQNIDKQEIGTILEDLRDERNKADYDEFFNNLETNTKLVLISAKTALELLVKIYG